MSSAFRLRFIGPVDNRLRDEARRFTRWVREWYTFPNPLELRLVGVGELVGDDGDASALRWWQTERGRQGVVAEIAVGSFARNLEDEGEWVAYPTVLAAIGRVLKYYFDATRNAPIRQDYADRWGDRLLAAYLDDSTPPPPRSGMKPAEPEASSPA